MTAGDTMIDIKLAREILGLTQSELAGSIGLSRVIVGQIERRQKPLQRQTSLAIECLLRRNNLPIPTAEPADKKKYSADS
ncbi:helix-turn-helix domain-containing protein [Oceanobacter antarcticus]|uniref:Helix-turn-helix transcriptional regulator n=1 Tax=Oceanobacter antarcticus TaxID=3133425 RepID=A0ABW8NF92_9GAMM